MLQLISLVIFLISASVVTFILFRKIPELVALPKNGHHGFKKHELILKIETKVKDSYFHLFSKQMLLQRVLSKLRLLILKIEKSIDILLHGIRKKSQQIDKNTKKKHRSI